ncbi:GTPase IMAP family member 8-like [Sardina pilchardus]|uniref:GTPase IMAP family member 8-like n=1 Tax=Sardina pilchardus TaxID=27697 RepID=UPI002E0DE75D
MSNAKFIIVVLGSDWTVDGNVQSPVKCQSTMKGDTLIISTPEASRFDEKDLFHLMHLCYPGPNVYLLNQGVKLEEWQRILGNDISHNIIYNGNRPNQLEGLDTKCVIGDTTQQLIKSCMVMFDKIPVHCFRELLTGKKARLHQHQRFPKLDQGVQLVLLGESGSGKSSSGNTILGEKRFRAEPSSIPITTKCQIQPINVRANINIIDTPDLSDDEHPDQLKQAMKCKELCGNGARVYLLAIQIGRFTEGERDILERLDRVLGPKLKDRTIILFTHGDDLGNQTIVNYVNRTDRHLQILIENCGNRYQVFNNRDKEEAKQQVRELIGKVATLVREVDGVTVSECDFQNNNADLKNSNTEGTSFGFWPFGKITKK